MVIIFTSKIPLRVFEISQDSELSTVSTSLENRESSLPTGVTSKNCSGDLSTLSNMSACNNLAAFQHAKNGIRSVNRDARAENTK